MSSLKDWAIAHASILVFALALRDLAAAPDASLSDNHRETEVNSATTGLTPRSRRLMVGQ